MTLPYSKDWTSNFILVLFLLWFNDREKHLWDVARALIFLSENPLDFHAEIWSVLPIDWNTK